MKEKNNQLLKVAQFLLCIFILGAPVVHAADYDLDSGDQAKVDEALKPLNKVIGFVRYAATTVGVLVLAIAGVMFATSGSEPKKKDSAKGMVTYAIIGLGVVWAAPIFISLLQ